MILMNMIPEIVGAMLQTMRYTTNEDSKEYAIHQARAVRGGKEEKTGPTLDLDLNENDEQKKDTFEEPPPPDAINTNEDWLCYMGREQEHEEIVPDRKAASEASRVLVITAASMDTESTSVAR